MNHKSVLMAQSAISSLPSRQLQRMLHVLVPSSKHLARSLLAWAPTLAKYIVGLLFLANVKSWPLAWHFRVFRPIFAIRFRYHLLRLRICFRSRRVQELEEDKWIDSISPVGAHPFEFTTRVHTRATIDDSDFYGHLSNSSYAKALDSGRFKAAFAMVPHFFRAGGWVALGGAPGIHPFLALAYPNIKAHTTVFVREIPMFSAYEVRITYGGWDHKWVYLVARFVTKKKQGLKDAKNRNTPNSTHTLMATATTTTTDVHSVSTTSTMAPTASGSEPDDIPKDLDAVLAELLSGMKEEEDVVLNAVVISQICFKVGRITVPPAVVLASNGFSAPSTSGLEYSHQNTPPHWSAVKDLMSKPRGGSTKKLHDFLKSDWKEVPEDKRWWQDALGGVIEERRRRNMVVLDSLRKGMLGARAV